MAHGKKTRTSRREFTKTMVAASATLPLLSQTPSVAGVGTSTSSLLNRQAAATAEPAPPGVEGLTQFIKERYGDKLSAAQLADIRAAIERQLRTSQRYGRLALKNSDEPDFIFHA